MGIAGVEISGEGQAVEETQIQLGDHTGTIVAGDTEGSPLGCLIPVLIALAVILTIIIIAA